MSNALLITVDATTAQFDRAMNSAQKSTLRYQGSLKLAQRAQIEFDAAVAASGASSEEAYLAQVKLGAALARTTEAEIRAGTAAKAAGEIQAASSAQAAAAAERSAAAQAAASAKASRAAEAAAVKQAAAVKKIGTFAGGVGVAAAVALGLAAKAASDFGSKIAQVRTLSGASATEVAALADATKQYAGIGISASQAADAEIELIKAGVSVKDILTGGLTGALNLAAAGQLNVADATAIASAAMTQFGLVGKDIPHIADLLAAGANKSLGSVQDLGMGLKAVGTTAHQAGFGIDETVGALAALAKAGLTAELGGTALKQMFLKLEAPSAKAKGLMEQYGISLYDASGNVKSLKDVAGELKANLSDLDPATRNAALATIFGSRAVQAANVLYQQGSTGIADWTRKVNDSGAAARTTAGQMDSLKGDMQKLRAEVSNAAIDFGERMQPALREVTQLLEGFVGALDAIPGPIKDAIALGIALTAVVGLSVFAYTRAKAGLLSLRTTLGLVAVAEGEAGAAAALANKRMMLIKGGAAIVGLALLSISESASKTDQNLGALTTTAGAAALGFAVGGPWGAAIGAAIGFAKEFASANDDIVAAMGNVDTAFGSNVINLQADAAALKALTTSYDAYQKKVEDSKQSLRDSFGGTFIPIAHIGDIATVLSDFVHGSGDDASDKIAETTARLAALRAGFHDAAVEMGGDNSNFDEIAATFKKLGYSTNTINDLILNRNRSAPDAIAWEQAVHAVEDYNTAQDSAAGKSKAVGDAIDGLDANLLSTASSAKEVKTALDALFGPQLTNVQATDQWTLALRHLNDELAKRTKKLTGDTDGAIKNRAAIGDLIGKYEDMLVAGAGVNESADQFNLRMRDQYYALIKAGVAAGISRQDMVAYLATLGLTPKTVSTDIKANTGEALTGIALVKARLAEIKSRTVELRINSIYSTQGSGGHTVYTPAEGGYIRGAGTTTSDSIPAMLSDKEFVVKAAAVKHYGVGTLAAMNQMKLSGGGMATARWQNTSYTPVGSTWTTAPLAKAIDGMGAQIAHLERTLVENGIPVDAKIRNPEVLDGRSRRIAADEVSQQQAHDDTLAGMWASG